LPGSHIDSGAATPNSDFTLQSADGTRFAAYGARATRPTGAGMLVLPDVRGLHTYYKELALRFAEVGVDAVAIDLFGRTDKSGDRSDAFEYFPHVVQTKPGTLQADIAAGVAYLRTKEGGHARALFSVGFCFGGALSFLQAASGLGYAGVIGFYGWPLGTGWPGRLKPIHAVAFFRAPVLAIYGGADPGIPPSAVAEFDRALARAGVQHESVTYDGAPHSFFDRKQAEFADASADAWRKVQAFVTRHTPAA
jgi:carboxymethylenebutenolidase